MGRKRLMIKEVQKRRIDNISENLITILAVVSITAITIVSFVALVSLMIYFTEKKIIAGFKSKTEIKDLKSESNIRIEAIKEEKEKQ
ncbi:hypothetical protein KQI42_12950 [Tissierella sp. MSJ-40]|uniref:Uncharacterized protein n=1 Tax=Tissierella simiarum TaxID=2841534 RepID=A0ABS6E7N8_9FIRM|nr:hypothetical protein [Tissierella simiarum]MBU5438928.1 hypothetical protein [Tissierella simiarum]